MLLTRARSAQGFEELQYWIRNVPKWSSGVVQCTRLTLDKLTKNDYFVLCLHPAPRHKQSDQVLIQYLQGLAKLVKTADKQSSPEVFHAAVSAAAK